MWTAPGVRRAFGNTAEEAETTRILALNQGFYNLGAAGLPLGFHAVGDRAGVLGVLLFLAAMGLVGALSANWRILVLQALPALAGFLVVYLV